MSRVYLGSPGGPLVRARVTSSVASSFTTPAPTTTKPNADGVVDLSQFPPSKLRVIPFGAGSNDTTFDVRVIGWSNAAGLWVPLILAQFTATLSTAVGVAGATVTDTERFADTAGDPATNLGTKGTDCWIHTPQNNTPAQYLCDAEGCTLFQIDTATGTATAGNALVGAA